MEFFQSEQQLRVLCINTCTYACIYNIHLPVCTVYPMYTVYGYIQRLAVVYVATMLMFIAMQDVVFIF